MLMLNPLTLLRRQILPNTYPIGARRTSFSPAKAEVLFSAKNDKPKKPPVVLTLWKAKPGQVDSLLAGATVHHDPPDTFTVRFPDNPNQYDLVIEKQAGEIQWGLLQCLDSVQMPQILTYDIAEE